MLQLAEIGKDGSKEIHLQAGSVVFLMAENGNQTVHSDTTGLQLAENFVTARLVSGEVGEDLGGLVSLLALLVLYDLQRLTLMPCLHLPAYLIEVTHDVLHLQ